VSAKKLGARYALGTKLYAHNFSCAVEAALAGEDAVGAKQIEAPLACYVLLNPATYQLLL
jgi:hypothetical protein